MNIPRTVTPRSTDAYRIVDHDALTLPAVYERDLDILFVEELVASAEFVALVCRAVLPTWHAWGRPIHWDARRSVSSSAGETDIELVLFWRRARAAILIENKIDATFQPEQGSRYLQRALQYAEAGYAPTKVLLLAPQSYLESAGADGAQFDGELSYEEVARYFADRDTRFAGVSDELAARARLRHEFVQQAIDKARRGTASVPDEAVTAFWRAYWEVASRKAPGLQLAEPGSKPARSLWGSFYSSLTKLPGGPAVVLRHKTTHGRVDIEMAGLAEHLGNLEEFLAALIPEAAMLRAVGKSVAISVDVPIVDPSLPFATQEAQCLVALGALEALQAWWNANVESIARHLHLTLDAVASDE